MTSKSMLLSVPISTLSRDFSLTTATLARSFSIPLPFSGSAKTSCRYYSTNPPDTSYRRIRQTPRPSSAAGRHRTAPPATRRPVVPRYEEPAIDEVEVIVPENPNGVLGHSHSGAKLLQQPALIVTRQIEMLNIFAGFEQANKYSICNAQGETVGFLMEEDQGFASTLSRQLLRTRRPFRASILDLDGTPILWFRRPFQWINSRIYVHASGLITRGDSEGSKIVGEAQQRWHLWRRKYDLFVNGDDAASNEQNFNQFAAVDEPFLSWEFFLKDPEGNARASISRNFGGFAREIFTDTGSYAIRFDAVSEEIANARQSPSSSSTSSSTAASAQMLPPRSSGLTLDERAVTLAMAVSADFDYFSRHSQGGTGGFFPFPFFGFGGGELAGGEVAASEIAGAAGEATVAEEEGAASARARFPNAESEEAQAGEGQWWENQLPEDEEIMEDPWAGPNKGEGDSWGNWGGSDSEGEGWGI